MHETGVNKIIPKLVKNGTVYGGGSAGIIVASPTLKHIDKADDPKDAPKVLWDGMKLIDNVVVPHVGNEKYGKIMDGVIASLKEDGYKVTGITDKQAVIVNGADSKIVHQ